MLQWLPLSLRRKAALALWPECEQIADERARHRLSMRMSVSTVLKNHLRRLAHLYGEHTGMPRGDVYRNATGLLAVNNIPDPKKVAGIAWFSAHWPCDLPWPEDIPRPKIEEKA